MTYIKSNTIEQEFLLEDELSPNNMTKLFYWSGSAKLLKLILDLQAKSPKHKREQILLAFNVGDLYDPTYYKRIREALEKLEKKI